MFFNEPFGGIIPGARGAVLAVLLRNGILLTGRQIHRLVSDHYSLWTVQEALKALTRLGLVETQTIGRAGVHTINEVHASVAPLRALLDPIAALRAAISSGDRRRTCRWWSSSGRSPAVRRPTDSDIDLAVIAPSGWEKRVQLGESVRAHWATTAMSSSSPKPTTGSATSGEPVVNDILQDGVALIGAKPRVKHGAAYGHRRPAKPRQELPQEGRGDLASAEANLAAKRYTPAAGDAIHAGITRRTRSSPRSPVRRAREGPRHLSEGTPADAGQASRAPLARRHCVMVAAKGDVEYGTDVVTAVKAEPLVRRARTLVELAIEIVRLGR